MPRGGQVMKSSSVVLEVTFWILVTKRVRCAKCRKAVAIEWRWKFVNPLLCETCARRMNREATLILEEYYDWKQKGRSGNGEGRRPK